MERYSPLAKRTLQVAKHYVGVKEWSGKNDGPVVRMFQRFIDPALRYLENAPWCVCFALFCVHTAARDLKTASRLPKTASSSTLYRWFEQQGLLIKEPVPGCVGMVRGGRTGHSHTFLVHEVVCGQGASEGRAVSVIGVDGNFRNAVGWSRRPVGSCDYGRIV